MNEKKCYNKPKVKIEIFDFDEVLTGVQGSIEPDKDYDDGEWFD